MSTQKEKKYIINKKLVGLYDGRDCECLSDVLDEISSTPDMVKLSLSTNTRGGTFYKDLIDALTSESEAVIDTLYAFVQLL